MAISEHERKLIVIAIILAILERFTNMLGKLNLIWATTVLGGFASFLAQKDFSAVSVILVVEGIRLLGRRGELHTSSYYFMTIIILYLSLIQELSAVICGYLSFNRVKSADYGPSDQARNRNAALKLFYWVSIVESVLILLGFLFRLYTGITPHLWPLKEGTRRGSRDIWISGSVLEVKKKYGLDNSQIITLYMFFNHTYSRCVRGSIFDSWRMTIVSYSVELLQSSNGDEQLKGAKLLWGLVKDDPGALDRLRSIGTIRSVVGMLIDMLKDSNESPDKEIRVAAAGVISNLVKIGRNHTLVMAAPNSMESIASLLDDVNQVEINSSQNRTQSLPDSNLREVGLGILKELANDPDNHAKMGSNRGLLLKIITFTESNTPELEAIETLTSIARDQEFRESIGGTDGVLYNFYSLFFADININQGELKIRRAGEALGFLSLENHHNCEILMNFPYLIEDLISALNKPVQGTYAARILRNLYAHLEANSVELEANSVNLNKIRAASAEIMNLSSENRGGFHR